MFSFYWALEAKTARIKCTISNCRLQQLLSKSCRSKCNLNLKLRFSDHSVWFGITQWDWSALIFQCTVYLFLSWIVSAHLFSLDFFHFFSLYCLWIRISHFVKESANINFNFFFFLSKLGSCNSWYHAINY